MSNLASSSAGEDPARGNYSDVYPSPKIADPLQSFKDVGVDTVGQTVQEDPGEEGLQGLQTNEKALPAAGPATHHLSKSVTQPPEPILRLRKSWIRSLHPDDAGALASQANNLGIARWMRNAFPHPYRVEDAANWISIATSASPHHNYAICRPDENTVIGGIGLKPADDVRYRTMQIGYWLGEEYWRQGIATEAVSVFSEWTFEQFKHVIRLEAEVYQGNGSSARVLEKAGYTFEAEHRNVVEKMGVVMNVKSTFSHASYANFRPSYSPSLYQIIINYHHGPKAHCVDLGSGHGVVAREFASSFDRVIGTDPSSGMIQQARSLTSTGAYPNVTYEQASAESLPFLADHSVDMVVSGQAAHWFDPERFFPEMKRVVRSGGTLALWCYKDHVFVDYPRATQVLNRYSYGEGERELGPYWQQPGRSRVQNKLRDLRPPQGEWTDVQRIEYEPGIKGPKSGEGTMFLSKRMTLGDCMNYIRTWSAFAGWQEKYPHLKKREDGGSGDVIDEMFDDMVESEPDWATCSDWRGKEVNIEWGSGLVLARKN